MTDRMKFILSIFFCFFLAAVMVRDIEIIVSEPTVFISLYFFGLFVSYYIVAYMVGWNMLNYGGNMLKRGEHDVLRAILFLVFICIWIGLFFRP